MDFTFEALERWPYGGKVLNKSPFKANINKTYAQLRAELKHLGARSPVIQTGHDAADIRFDGLPRANARLPRFPGVCLVFQRRIAGEWRFVEMPCTQYRYFEDNLRAIVLTLEALRAVGRYGVIGTNVEGAGASTTEAGKQYEGFARKKVEAQTGSPANGHMTREAAAAVLAACAQGGWTAASLMTASPDEIERCYKQAARNEHPDVGGSHETFVRVGEAYSVLGVGQAKV